MLPLTVMNPVEFVFWPVRTLRWRWAQPPAPVPVRRRQRPAVQVLGRVAHEPVTATGFAVAAAQLLVVVVVVVTQHMTHTRRVEKKKMEAVEIKLCSNVL